MRKVTRVVAAGHETVHPNICSVCKQAGFNRATRRRAHDMNRKGLISAREVSTATFEMLKHHRRAQS